jgi:hypothetical protein
VALEVFFQRQLLSHKLEIFQRKCNLPWAYDDIAVNSINQHSKSSPTGLRLEPELFEQLATVLTTTPRRQLFDKKVRNYSLLDKFLNPYLNSSLK